MDDNHPPSDGDLTLNPDGSLTYVPGDDFSGTDSFSYQIQDGTGQLSNVVTDTITINPLAVTDRFTTTFNTAVGLDLASNDAGTGPLVAAVVSGKGPTHGTLSANFDGGITYQPDDGFSGTDSFTYQDTDVNGLVSNEVTDTITVLAANTFLVTNTYDSGAGTLRQAILDANSAAAPATIQFLLPASDPGHFYYQDDQTAGQITLGSRAVTTANDDTTLADIDPDWAHSWWTIAPLTPLPAITNALIIDGYSQAGASANTLAQGDNAVLRVELSGAGFHNAAGLLITAGNCTVRGLIIDRFTGSNTPAIDLASGGGSAIQGDFLGTDPSGTAAQSNGCGVLTTAANNLIGGTATGDRNVISGNNADGVEIAGSGATGNVIAGNYIGTNLAGTAALANGAAGVNIHLGASGNRVGADGSSAADDAAAQYHRGQHPGRGTHHGCWNQQQRGGRQLHRDRPHGRSCHGEQRRRLVRL